MSLVLIGRQTCRLCRAPQSAACSAWRSTVPGPPTSKLVDTPLLSLFPARRRFLDVLRARFAMQTGGGQHPRPALAPAEPRPRKRAASSEGEDEAGARPALPRTRTVVRVPRGPAAAAVMAAAAAAQAAAAGFAGNGFGHVTVHKVLDWWLGAAETDGRNASRRPSRLPIGRSPACGAA